MRRYRQNDVAVPVCGCPFVEIDVAGSGERNDHSVGKVDARIAVRYDPADALPLVDGDVTVLSKEGR